MHILINLGLIDQNMKGADEYSNHVGGLEKRWCNACFLHAAMYISLSMPKCLDVDSFASLLHDISCCQMKKKILFFFNFFSFLLLPRAWEVSDKSRANV